jgi:cob(I)alamin adenosyltransferase
MGNAICRLGQDIMNDDSVKTGAEPPRVLLFTGDGKGKTTAALGLALRAAGHGLRVRILQFIKSDAATGEIAALAHVPNISISPCGRGFVPPPGHMAFAAHRQAAEAGLTEAEQALTAGSCDVLVLDEIVGAVVRNLLPETRVTALMQQVPARVVLVLTGRGATPGLIALADTVTEMRMVKHAHEQGRPAQRGVER